MSNLLSGPNAITPWISAAVLERLHKTTTATDLQVTGPKLAQLIDLTRVVGGDINNTDDNNNNNKSSIQTKNDQNKADKGVAEPETVTETESKFQSTVAFISDGQVRIGVLLTASQRAALLKQGGDGLTGSLVRIPEGWRVVVGPRGQSLRLVLSDETSLQILGSRGLRTVGNPREIHYDIQVRRVLASLQWDVIHQRLSQAQLLEQSQQQQQQQHAPHIAEDTSFTSKSTTAVSTSLHDTCTTPASVDSQKNIPLGDTATFLGYCNEKTVSLPATARTTHDVQALFGKVLLAAAEQQKQKDEQSKEYGKELSNNGPKDHEQTKMQQHKHQPQGNRQTLLEEDPPNCGEWQDISDSRFPQSQLDYTSGNESPKYHPFRISAMLGPLEDSDQEEEEKERSPSVPQAGESQSTQNDADNSQLFETQEPAALGSATFSMQSNLLDLPVQRSECAGKLGTSPEAQVFGQAVTAISSEQKYRREEHDKQGLSQQNTESNAGKALSSEDLRGHEQPISKNTPHEQLHLDDYFTQPIQDGVAASPPLGMPKQSSLSTNRRGSTGGLADRPFHKTANRRGSTGAMETSVQNLNLDVTLGTLPQKQNKRKWTNIQGSYIETLLRSCCGFLPPQHKKACTDGWYGDELRTIVEQ